MDIGKTAGGTEFLKLKSGYKVFANTVKDSTEKRITISRFDGNGEDGKATYAKVNLSKDDLEKLTAFGTKWLE